MYRACLEDNWASNPAIDEESDVQRAKLSEDRGRFSDTRKRWSGEVSTRQILAGRYFHAYGRYEPTTSSSREFRSGKKEHEAKGVASVVQAKDRADAAKVLCSLRRGSKAGGAAEYPIKTPSAAAMPG